MLRTIVALCCLPLLGCPSPEPPQDADSPADMMDPPDTAPAADLRFPFRPVAINHVLCTGQSLSVGYASGAPVSTVQPYGNLMFNTGVLAGGTGLTALQPLVEKDVETMSSGMANLAARMAHDEVFAGQAPDTHDLLVSCHGISGIAYSGLKKGTGAYANGLAQARAAKMISEASGRSYVVRAVTNVHGESDHLAASTTYAQDLLTWQADYEADVKAITGQTEPVPMFHTQISSWTRYNTATSAIPAAQLKASLDRPDRMILVGAKYFLPYSDGVHLTSQGYRWLGEYYAKAYRRVVLEGKPFQPLRPLRATRNGAVIDVTFLVPAPPLQLDTTRVSDPGRYGFELADDSAAPPAVKSVELTGPDTVRVTLERAPGANPRLRYAFTGKVNANAGPQTGPRGNLRDSDATVSRNGNDLFNWCIHFELPVP